MHKLLLLVVMVVLLCNCEKEDSSIEFTNDSFLNLLIRKGIDLNKDGKVSVSEAEAVRKLDISYGSLTSLDENEVV